MFITFEGIEGCGKSTQARMLHAWLLQRDVDCVLTREPGGSKLGRTIRSILLDSGNSDLSPWAELFLYMADRVQHLQEVVLPALNQGRAVIADRYADSTLVYQGYGRGLDIKELQHMHQVSTRGMWPDITFLLDLPVEMGLERALSRNRSQDLQEKEGRFEEEDILFHRRVRKGYLDMAAVHKDRFVVINATEDKAGISENVIIQLRKKFDI